MTPLVARLQESDTAAVAAVGGALAGALVPDAFFWLFLILLGTNFCDWLAGRHAARATRTFDRTKSRNGLVGKALQMVILLALRSLEYVLTITDLPSTLGLVSAALALALIVEDIESLERHLVRLGGSPIPGLSAVLAKLRAVTGSERRTEGDGPPADVGERRAVERKVS